MPDLTLELSKSALGTPAYMDLALGPTGDLQLSQGVAAISQAVTLRLNAFTQDYFLALDDGIDYYGGLLDGRQSMTPAFEAALQNTVLQTPGIQGLLSWQTTYNAQRRFLSIAFEAQCSGGVVSFSVPVGAEGAA